jgi:hypothetical protein
MRCSIRPQVGLTQGFFMLSIRKGAFFNDNLEFGVGGKLHIQVPASLHNMIFEPFS